MKFPTGVEPLPAFSTAFRSWSAACWIGAQWDLKTLVWLGVGVSTCFFFLPKIKKGQCLPVKFIGKHIPSGYLAWPWKITIFKNGKPSVSMGHLYHGKLLNNQRVQVMNLQIHILEFKSVVFQRTTKKRRHGLSWKTHRLGLPENGGYSDNCHCGSKSKWTRLYRIFFVWTTNDAFSKSILGYHIHRIIISWSHMNIN